MKLTERLERLIDHRIVVEMPLEGREENMMKSTLKEVGEDYIVVTDWVHIAGTSTGGNRFIPISKINTIVQLDA